MFIFIVASLVVAIVLYEIVKQLLKAKPRFPYPPGPTPTHWFLGNAREFPDIRKGKHIDTKFLEWSKEYGLYFTIHIPVVGKMIVIADPEFAKHVLVTKNFTKSFTYKQYTPIFGSQSMLILPDKEWQATRRAFNPGFVPTFLKNSVTLIDDKLKRFVRNIENDIAEGVTTVMINRAQTFTGDVLVQAAFSEDWKGDHIHPARKWHTELQDLCAFKSSNVSVMIFGWRIYLRIWRLERMLDAEMRKIIDRRLTAPTMENKDILSMAIELMLNENGHLDETGKTVVVHQLKTLFFAGSETSATLISWAIWLLSQHSRVLQNLRDELKALKIYENENPPTFEELQKCVFLDAVLKETLRLYPPATGSARYTSNVDETWTDPKTGETYTVGGAVCYVTSYVMHRHPMLWKDPDAFIPERFLDGSEENLSAKFVPFSRGPRDCLGKYFGELLLRIWIC